MALDYANIMAAGQNLVPDLQAQMMQRQQFEMNRDYRQQQQDIARQGAEAKQHLFDRRQQFEAAAAEAARSGDPNAIKNLMIQFPEFADELKQGWGVLSDESRTRNITQVGSMYSRAMAGDYEGAAVILEQRIAADKAAGQDTSEDERLLAALRSGDPQQQQIAMSTMGFQLAAINPDKFGETYGKLNPKETQTPAQKEYEWRVRQFGKASADEWLAMQDDSLVSVVPGGSVYRKSDFVGGGGAPAATAPGGAQPGGGGQAAPTGGQAMSGDGIEAKAKQVVPGVIVTSRQRSASHNAAVGGVTDSYHLTGQARDFTPPRGMSMAQLHAKLKAAFPGYDVLNEGDHVHIEPGPSMGRGKPRYAESKTVNGKTYYRFGQKWFDNPEGK